MKTKITLALGACVIGAAVCAADFAKVAAEKLRVSAEQGNVEAQSVLGFYYEEGHGVEQSYAEAAKWYRAAAERGDVWAQNKLREFYEKGCGVEQSYTEAAKWYRAAAEQGDDRAQSKLEGMNGSTSEVVGILVVALVVFVVVLFIALSTLDMRKEKKKQVGSNSLCGEGDCYAPAIEVDSEGEGTLEGVEPDILCGVLLSSSSPAVVAEHLSAPPEGDKTSDTSVLDQVKKPWISFEGRARRSEYWLKAIFLGGIDIGIGYWLCFLGICGSLASSGNGGLLIIFGVSLILFAIPWVLSVTVRRFHDRNMSGWWVVLYWSFNWGLAFFVPVVAWIVGVVFFVILACMDGTPGSNQYGKNPKEEGSRLSKRDTSVDSCQQKSDSEPVLQSEVKLNKPSIESRLALINGLFERGVITEEEYNHKREAIIAEI